MKKLSVTKRGGATIGGQIVNRTQMHGKKEKVPAISLRISGIILTEEEFCVLMNDPHAYEAFFTNERSSIMEPRFTNMPRIPIDNTYEGAKVTIEVEDADEPLVLKPAKIGSMGITPAGSQPVLDCMISGVPDVHLETLTLLNKKCRISILNGALAEKDDRQRDLPLDGDGPAAPADGDADSDTLTTLAEVEREEEDATHAATGDSTIGRQIRGSEAKKKRASRKK